MFHTLQVFPDITFCNVNPLSVSRESKTWDEYQAFVTEKANRLTMQALDNEIPQYFSSNTYEQLWIDLLSPMSYFANFPILKNTNLNRSDTKDADLLQTIVDINVLDWSWTTDDTSTKYASENIRLRWHPSYHHCYTLRVPEDRTEVPQPDCLMNVRKLS